ncbi:MAG: hypothetical protein U0Z26_07760 [Anaerolineales bacterium]
MEKPTLRALSVPELLDKALQIYRGHVPLLMGIGALIFVPITIIHSIAVLYLKDTRFVDIATGYLMAPFASLAMIVAISNLYLGKDVNISSSYSIGSKKYWPVLGAAWLFGLAVGICAAVIVLIALGGGGAAIFGGILVVPIIIFLGNRWLLYMVTIVLEEKTGASTGLRRSWFLTEEYFWRVLGTSFASSLLAILLSYLPTLLANFFLIRLFGMSPLTGNVVTSAFQQLILIVTLPFTMGVKVLIYYDLRIRKEGFDLIAMADDLNPS